jgi:FkbM family methyltransferase
VRFLPVVSTGVHPTSVSTPGLSPSTPGVLVLHHFLGSWKKRHGYKSKGLLSLFMTVCKWFASHKPLHLVPVVPYSKTPELEHYPVSINHAGTVFTMMVNLIDHGDLQSHEDVSAILTRFGNWQAGMENTLTPRAPVALIGALGKAAPDSPAAADKPVFLDIGAGIGFYSMTAAARGHRVIATELAHRSVAVFRDSIEQNGFQALIDVRGVAVGAEAGPVCVAPRPNVPLLHAWRLEDVQRGYAAPQVHQWTGQFVCDRVVQRVLMGDLVPDGLHVGAVRVSAGGWSGEVLRGGLPFLEKNRPAAILVEVDMAEMARVGSHDFIDVVHSLTAIGYGNLGHSGRVCVERFESMLATLSQEHGKAHAQDHALRTDVNDLRQPAWCALDPINVAGVLEQNRRNGLEKQDTLNAAGVELFLLQLNVTAPSS